MMKKTVLILTICIFALGAMAQADPTAILNYGTVERSVQKSEEQIKDEKKMSNPKTWANRGNAYHDAYKVDIQNLLIGATTPMLAKQTYGSPKETLNQDGMEVLVYERTKLFFKDGKLEKWEKTEQIHEDPLPVVYESYKKAIELDDKGKYGKRLTSQIEDFKTSAFTEAIIAYNQEDYETAHKYFALISKAQELPGYEGTIDTNSIFNAGLAANMAGDNENAIKYYRKAVEAGYSDVNVFHFLTSLYLEGGDTTKFLDIAKVGFERHPNDAQITNKLIYGFIMTEQNEEAIEFIQEARKKDASNPVLYTAEGSVREDMGDVDTAEELYKKALEIDSEHFTANYNLGALYYNQAKEIFDGLGDIKEQEKYDAEQARGNEMLEKCVPYLETALEQQNDEKALVETLKVVYYRLGEKDKVQEMEILLKTMD